MNAQNNMNLFYSTKQNKEASKKALSNI